MSLFSNMEKLHGFSFLSTGFLSISVHFLKIFPSHARPHFSFSKQFYQHEADIVNIQDCFYTTSLASTDSSVCEWRIYYNVFVTLMSVFDDNLNNTNRSVSVYGSVPPAEQAHATLTLTTAMYGHLTGGIIPAL